MFDSFKVIELYLNLFFFVVNVGNKIRVKKMMKKKKRMVGNERQKVPKKIFARGVGLARYKIAKCLLDGLVGKQPLIKQVGAKNKYRFFIFNYLLLLLSCVMITI